MSFDGSRYIHHLAKRLVSEFEFSAEAGTPGLIGAAKEHPARVHLASILPDGVGVGSGIVVDSYGGASKQQDIVIYERRCPIFSQNDTAEATFYPVEGVIATGEVKSTLTKSELRDSFGKCHSVKKLRRYAVATQDPLNLEPTVDYRIYGDGTCFLGTKEEGFNQDKNSLDQIYTFILCEKFGSSADTTLANAAALYRDYDIAVGPNAIFSLKDGFLLPYASAKNSIVRSPMEADRIIFCNDPDNSFAQLLSMVRIYVRSGRTVTTNSYERYYYQNGEKPLLNVSAVAPL